MASNRMPVLFISHGPGPAWLLKDFYSDCHSQSPSALFLKNLRQTVLGEVPPIKAVLVVSAHWDEPKFTVQTTTTPELYYDYTGYPPETYDLAWRVPGAPQQAIRARQVLEQAGLSVEENGTRGLDHGVFVPLSLVFKDADVPSEWHFFSQISGS